MKDSFKFSWQPELENPSLVVSWEEDAGKVGPKVIDYLNKKIKGNFFCEIEPVGFFSLGGVTIKNDIAQFPESKFYAIERKDLVTFNGSEPQFEQYKFLQAILDVAEHYGQVKELYTISGTISSIAHTAPRRVLAVFNQPEFQRRLRGYDLLDMTWEGRPHINSFLLWEAQRRNIPGVSLWPEIPFYLAASEDPQAIRLIISFLDQRFNLGLNLGELDLEIRRQNEKIAQLREENPEINKSIGMLENGFSLSEEEQLKLAKEVYELLEKRG